mgnify:CR=1 FL=1
MPPFIALIIWIAFILVVFIIDIKQNPKVSKSLILPGVWLLFNIRSPSNWLNFVYPMDNYLTKVNYTEGNPIDRNIYFVLIMLGLYMLSRRKISWREMIRNNVWLTLFIFYCFISILWSAYPFVAFKRWFLFVGEVIIILIILTDRDPDNAIKTIIRRNAYFCISLSLLLVKYFPEYGRTYSPFSGQAMFTGISSHKNPFGLLCMLFGLYFFWNLISLWTKRKVMKIQKEEIVIQLIYLLMILWLLYIANSATSLLCLIIGSIIILFLKTPYIENRKNYIFIYSFSIIVIPIFIYMLFDLHTIILTYLGRDATFTGRTYIWENVLNVAINPIIGKGFQSFWIGSTVDVISDGYASILNQAHNGYLEIYLNLGYIGLCILIGIIFSAFINVKNKILFSTDFSYFCFAITIIVLLYNITEAYFRYKTLLWFVFLTLCVIKPKKIHY